MSVHSLAGGHVTAANRRGFTLVEIMIVVALMGAMMAIALPRGRAVFIRTNVRAARTTVFNAVQQAKVIAASQGRAAQVNFEAGGRMFISASPRRAPCPGGGCTRDTIGLVRELGTQYGVAVTPTQNTYAFDSRGLGANASPPITIEVRREVERDTVWIRGFGRVER
jgi:prepilin-type N-terminal cleavage/methylation domain-containing protein